MTPMPLQKMLDFHPVIYCVMDREGNLIHVCGTTLDLLGYQQQELEGKSCLEFIIESDHEAVRDAFRRVQQGQFIEKFECRYYHRNGQLVTLSWSGLWDKEEGHIYVIGHVVNEQPSVEQIQQALSRKLNQNNRKLSEAFDRVTDGFCTLDEEWRFVYVNRAAEEILQMDKEEILGRAVWECFPAAAGTIIEQEYRRCFEQQVQVSFEAFYPDPLNKWFEITAYPSSAGITVFFRDITDRKRMEEEMSKLSLIIRKTRNLVVLCDVGGRIKWANDAFLEKTGYAFPEVQGRRPGDLLAGPGTDLQVLEQIRCKYLRGESFQEEIQYYSKKGEPFWVAITGQPLKDAAGNIHELFSIKTDITEKKMLEIQLLQEREARQRKITAAIIQAQEDERTEIGKELHDNVNQVLTTVKLLLETSLHPGTDRDGLTKKSIQLLLDSISELRYLSRQLSARAIDETTLGESVQELCENISATKQFSLQLDLSGIEGLEVAEQLHLTVYRILQEHLTNVLRHAEAKNVTVTLGLSEGGILLKVTDDGRGFDTTRQRKGIGITNIMIRTESLDGSFRLDSAPGAGCILEVWLPLAEQGESEIVNPEA